MKKATSHIEITIQEETALGTCKMTLNPSILETMFKGLNLLFEVEILQGSITKDGTNTIIEFEASEKKLTVLRKAFVYQTYLANRNSN